MAGVGLIGGVDYYGLQLVARGDLCRPALLGKAMTNDTGEDVGVTGVQVRWGRTIEGDRQCDRGDLTDASLCTHIIFQPAPYGAEDSHTSKQRRIPNQRFEGRLRTGQDMEWKNGHDINIYYSGEWQSHKTGLGWKRLMLDLV